MLNSAFWMIRAASECEFCHVSKLKYWIIVWAKTPVGSPFEMQRKTWFLWLDSMFWASHTGEGSLVGRTNKYTDVIAARLGKTCSSVATTCHYRDNNRQSNSSFCSRNYFLWLSFPKFCFADPYWNESESGIFVDATDQIIPKKVQAPPLMTELHPPPLGIWGQYSTAKMRSGSAGLGLWVRRLSYSRSSDFPSGSLGCHFSPTDRLLQSDTNSVKGRCVLKVFPELFRIIS
jgi:hypothetical protein